MEQQKIHCALRSANSDNQQVSSRGQSCSPRNSLQQDNITTSLEISEASSVNWRIPEQRCAVLTFLMQVSDGHWRIVALPRQCFDQQNWIGTSAKLIMDGLQLVSAPSFNASRADQPKVLGRPQPHFPRYITSPTAKNFHRSYVRHQYHSKAFTNKVTRPNGFPGYSGCQSSVTYSDSHVLVSEECSAVASSDACIGGAKTDADVKKKAKKKTRKKRKQNKKVSSDTGSTEQEVLSENANGSSTSDTCGCNEHVDELVSSATSPEVSLADGSMGGIEDVTTAFNRFKALGQCKSSIDEVNVLETILPSMDQNLPEHQVGKSEVRIEVKDHGFSMLEGGVAEPNHLFMSRSDDMHSNGFSCVPNSLVQGSVSVSSASYSRKPFDKESHGVILSKTPEFNTQKENHSDRKLSNGAEDTDENIEGPKPGSQNVNSSNMQLPVPGKRGKHKKSPPITPNIYRVGNARTGKENNHSVWQKVQRNDSDECNGESKKVHVASELGVSLKEAHSVKRDNNVAGITLSSRTEDKVQPKEKVSKKLKRKNSPGPKQESNLCERWGAHLKKSSLSTHTNTSMQQNEMLDILAQQNDQKAVMCVSRSSSQNGLPKDGSQINKNECLSSESVHSLQGSPDTAGQPESTYDVFSDIKHLPTKNGDVAMPRSCDCSEQNHLLGNKALKMEKEVTLSECSKQNHNSGSMQKWVPIAVKDPGLATSTRFESSSMDCSNAPAGAHWNIRSSAEEKVAFNSQDVSSLTLSMADSSGVANSFNHEDDHVQRSRSATTGMLEQSKKQVAGSHSSSEYRDKKFSTFGAESKKFVQALNDACKVRLASEAVQRATGGPIAELERVLHLSSPVICQSLGVFSRQTCLHDQAAVSLCRCETPNLPLECLWQWYEKHGSYGLEVRAQDYENPKRFGIDSFSFRAYFVPFLSAVQLFKSHESQAAKNNNEVSGPGILETSENGETSGNSNSGNLSMFSVLVPQPCTSDSAHSVEKPWFDDMELLFEYFESEQPQQRRPLYEKIQELVRGDGPSKCKMYGDPSNLVSVNLRDLHPRSWYSVAWYPIYRNPHGTLRAAFLTYHSLGHLVRSPGKLDSSSMDGCIVSPVVGLQTYNAQGECWFQLRHKEATQTTEIPSINPSGILKERLRTLEQTASLMARAVVVKGNQTSMNRHPDYEFFLSRRS